MATLKYAVLSHNTMPQMSHILREHIIGMLAPGMTTRAVARSFNVHFSTISHLENLAVHPTDLTTADHVYDIVGMSGLQLYV